MTIPLSAIVAVVLVLFVWALFRSTSRKTNVNAGEFAQDVVNQMVQAMVFGAVLRMIPIFIVVGIIIFITGIGLDPETRKFSTQKVVYTAGAFLQPSDKFESGPERIRDGFAKTPPKPAEKPLQKPLVVRKDAFADTLVIQPVEEKPVNLPAQSRFRLVATAYSPDQLSADIREYEKYLNDVPVNPVIYYSAGSNEIKQGIQLGDNQPNKEKAYALFDVIAKKWYTRTGRHLNPAKFRVQDFD